MAAVGIGITGTRNRPELTLSTSHPYSLAFGVNGEHVEYSWPFDLALGEHEVVITLMTNYGDVAAGRVRYRVSR